MTFQLLRRGDRNHTLAYEAMSGAHISQLTYSHFSAEPFSSCELLLLLQRLLLLLADALFELVPLLLALGVFESPKSNAFGGLFVG